MHTHSTGAMIPVKTEAAAIYARFSSDLGLDSSIEQQVFQCRTYGTALNLTVDDDDVYADHAITGRTDDRNGLERLKAAVRSGRANFRHLLIADTSRLARDRGDADRLVKFFREYRVTVHFVADGMRSDASSFAIFHGIKSIMDEAYSVGIAEKTSRGQHGRVRDHKQPCGKTYGYAHDYIIDHTRKGLHGKPKVLAVRQVINHAEAAVVRRIFMMYADGVGGYNQIARILNQEGVKPPRNPHKDKHPGWNHSAVRYMLKNERYIGIVHFGRTYTIVASDRNAMGRRGIRHRRQEDPSKVTTMTDESLRIISDELWMRAQARMKSNCKLSGHSKEGGSARPSGSPRYIFSGLLKCGQCGSTLRMWGGDQGGYRCNNAIRHLGCTNKVQIKRDLLELQLLTKLSELLLSTTTAESVRASFLRELTRQMAQEERRVADIHATREALEQENDQLRTEIGNLVMALAKNPNLNAIAEMIQKLTDRREVVQQQLAVAGPALQPVPVEEIDAFLQASFTKLAEILRGDPVLARRELAKRGLDLTLTPFLEDGAVVFAVKGFFTTFFDDDALLLASKTCHCFAGQQHLQALVISGIKLYCGKQSSRIVGSLFSSPSAA